MKLDDFRSNKTLMADYKKVINSDVMTILCGMLQETFCRPILPGQLGEHITRSTAEFSLGQVSGSWKMLDALRHLEVIDVKDETPAETYGTDAVEEPKKGDK